MLYVKYVGNNLNHILINRVLFLFQQYVILKNVNAYYFTMRERKHIKLQ